MKKSFFLPFLLFVVFSGYTQDRGLGTTSTVTDSIKRNLALVVGISSYPNINRLLYADDDANLFADYLVNEKICEKKDVTVLIDSVATKANFFKELRKLLDRSGPSDRVFIYFAGHGDVENDIESGFLLTYNCEPNNYPATDAIDISMLEKFVGAFTKKNTKVILITDACRSGNLAGGINGASTTISSLSKGFQNVIKILSCQPNQLSQEKNYPGGGHGIFTYHLVDALSGLADRDNDQHISLRELDRYLDEVADETGQQQVPKTEGDPLARIAAFNIELKQALIARKSDKNAMASAVKTRGTPDSTWLNNKWFLAFNEHIHKNRFVSPDKNNALSTINDAVAAKQPAAMLTDMRLELAAVLEDEAQKFINNYLRGALSNDHKLVLQQLYDAKQYITTLEQIIGKTDFRYDEIHVKKLFFDAYWIFRTTDKKKYKEAINLLETANKINGNQAWILNAMGLFYEDLKQPQKAEAAYKNASVLAPQWSYPWNNLGMLYWKTKQLKEAEKAYRKSLELDETYGFAWNGLGNVLDDLGREAEAVEAYKKSIRFNPFDDDPWNGMGNAYFDLKNNEEAEKAYRKAIEMDTTESFPWNGLGNIYMDQEKYIEAARFYLRSIEIDSTNAFVWNNLGILNENQHNYEEAAKYYTRATEVDSTYDAAWYNQGEIFLSRNDPDNALIAYRKALSINDKDPDYWNGLGRSYWRNYNYEKARNAYLEGLKQDSLNKHLWFNLGLVYKATEKYSDAAACFKKAVTIEPANKQNWDYLLDALEKSGNIKELDTWQKKKQAAFN